MSNKDLYYRIFCEIKYQVQVDLFDQRSKMINLFWKTDFPHWRIDNNYSIRFTNTEDPDKSKETLAIDPKRFAYDVEAPDTESFFIDKFKKYFNKFSRLLTVNNYSRVGVRSYMCQNGIKFNKTISNINNGILFEKNLLSSISENYSIKDFSVTLEQDDGRIIFGPMKKEEENLYLKQFKDISKLCNEFTFYDIDQSAKDVKPSNIDNIIKILHSKVLSYPQNIQKYLRGENAK